MSNVALVELIRQVNDLPSPPAVVMDLLNNIDREDMDVAVLANKVAQDQALTGKTLRLANSSYFATQIKLTTLQQAITLLGLRNMRNLITTAALSGCFPEQACAGFNHKTFWCHALTTASAAALVARHLKFNPDYAFTAGLLHDIGRLVLVTCQPKQYAQALAYQMEQNCPIVEAERAIFHIDHTQAGEVLAAHWNFSDALRLAIAGHHEPELPGAGFLASIVHIANAIAHQLEDIEEGAEIAAPLVSLTAWKAVNLNDEIYARICEEARAQFAKARDIVVA